MKRHAFLYNPAARGGKSESQFNKLKKLISQLPDSQLFRSSSKGDLSARVEDLLPEFDVFVACGGDGTVREIASELVQTDKTLGILPMGTGNDLCKSLNIPTAFDEAFELIWRGKTTAIDIGRCNDFIFLNTLGFGFDGLTNRYAYEMPNIPSILKYVFAALKASKNQERFYTTITVEGNNGAFQEQSLMVTVANGRVEGGSFWVAPQASITDGQLNLICLKPVSRWLIPILLPLLLVKKGDWVPQLETKLFKKITLEFEETVEIHADGEVVKSDAKTYQIEVLPRTLNVICRL